MVARWVCLDQMVFLVIAIQIIKEILGQGYQDYLDRNIVKVFLDENQNAYNFKRDIYDAEIGGVFRHVGFYGFQRETLFEYSSLPPSKNEIDNSLEQFRALDNGIKIKALITNSDQLAVDVPEDIDRIISKIKNLSKA